MTNEERDAAFERSLDVVTTAAGDRNMNRAGVLIAFSRHLDATDRAEAAMALFAEALSIEQEKMIANHPRLTRHLAEFEERFGATYDP